MPLRNTVEIDSTLAEWVHTCPDSGCLANNSDNSYHYPFERALWNDSAPFPMSYIGYKQVLRKYLCKSKTCRALTEPTERDAEGNDGSTDFTQWCWKPCKKTHHIWSYLCTMPAVYHVECFTDSTAGLLLTNNILSASVPCSRSTWHDCQLCHWCYCTFTILKRLLTLHKLTLLILHMHMSKSYTICNQLQRMRFCSFSTNGIHCAGTFIYKLNHFYSIFPFVAQN